MGRMFRIISDATEPAGRAAVLDAPAEAEDVPFVEVGGPAGVVWSAAKPAAVPVAVVPPKPTPVIAAPATDPRVLSVAFHTFPKPGLRMMPHGISPDVVAHHFPDHPIAAEYRLVRDEIRRPFEEAGPRTLLFTSAAAVAGTTTVLLNVAVTLADETAAKVLVVDANLARPAVARRLAVADTPGLSEVLGQTTPLAWAVQPTGIDRLHVLSAGTPTAATGTAEFPRLLAQLRQWFDWVLIDGGVWADAAAREAVAPACDAVYLVTRQGEIERPEFASLRAAVAAAGGLLRGYVTTRQ